MQIYIHYAHSVFKNSKWEINASVTLISTPTQFSAKTDKIKLSLKLVKKGKKIKSCLQVAYC